MIPRNATHALSLGWKPAEQPDIVKWAEESARFDSRTEASERYTIQRAPYMRKVFEWFQDDIVEQMIIIAAAQIGKTACMAILLGYCIRFDPGATLFASAEERLTRRYFKKRLMPFIRKTFPGMISKNRRNEDFNAEGVLVGQMSVIPAWGSNETTLRSWPCRYIFADETSAWRHTREYAWERTNNFKHNRKAIYVTTPTTEHEQTWKDAHESFQLHRWWVPCPHCGAFQTLEHKQVKFNHCKEGEVWNIERVKAEAYYECEHCEAKIENRDRYRMIAQGEARTDRPENDKSKKSLRITGLDVPVTTWGEYAAKWIDAQKTPEALKNFVNSVMADVWREAREGVRSQAILSRTMDISTGIIPNDTVTLGAGVDVQRGHLWYIVRAWMKDGRSVLVHCGHFDGRGDQKKNLSEEEQIISLRRAFEQLDANVLQRLWPIKDSEASAKIRFMAVDSGDGRTQQEVFRFAYQHPTRVFPVKGDSRSGTFTTTPISKDQQGRPLPGTLYTYNINTPHYRDSVVTSYQLSMGEAGAWLVARGTPQTYGDHMEAWQSVEVVSKDPKTQLVKSRKREWRQMSKDDHMQDAEIYCEALHQNLPGLGIIRVGPDGSGPKGKKYGIVGKSFGG